MTTETAPDIAQRWIAAMESSAQRIGRGAELLWDQSEAPVGLTPRELVGRKGKARLYLYRAQGEQADAVPVLFVPYLGISRTYVFDLPGASFVEFFTRQGINLYMLDWGDLGPEDANFKLEDAVMDTIPAIVRRVKRHSGSDTMDLFGYCMGTPMSMSYMATHPDAPVRNLVMMVGPIDFERGGFFAAWTAKDVFPVDKLVDTHKTAPLEYVRMGFKLLSPTGEMATMTNLWWNLGNEQYVQSWRSMNRWSNEWVGFPGEFFRQWIGWFYQENRLAKGQLVLRGHRVDLSTVHNPILVVAARKDTIAPPASARALVDLVGSADKEYEELPGGHISLIAGRQANQQLWPKLVSWLRARSGAAEASGD
ncbi:MAG: alpha/beta fold hydrolase [Dehalococcoidia bacterium]